MTAQAPTREIPSGCLRLIVFVLLSVSAEVGGIGLSIYLRAGLDREVCHVRGDFGDNISGEFGNGFDRGEFNGVRDLRCLDNGICRTVRRARGGKCCFINLCLCDEPDIIPDAYRCFLTCGIINAGNIVYAVGIIFIAGLVSIAVFGCAGFVAISASSFA